MSVPAPLLRELARLADSGAHEQLEARARDFLHRYPTSGVIMKVLALALWAQGKDALPQLERATVLLPDDAEAHGNLGNAYRASGRLENAVQCHRRAIDIAPLHAQSHNDLGTALLDLGRLDEAAVNFRRAVDLKPEFALAHSNLSHVLTLQNRIAEAEISCRRALELKPTLTAAIVQLAEHEAGRGQFTTAEELLRHALGIEPDMPEAWAGLVRWRKVVVADAAWLAAARRIVGLGLPPHREVPLQFALGKYFDDLAEHVTAFGHFRRANELARAGGSSYDRNGTTRIIDRLIASHDRHWLNRTRNGSQQSQTPVFVIGMPRSGTTLAEQILASHPGVFGAGELPFWGDAAARYGIEVSAGECAMQVLERLGGEYLFAVTALSPEAVRVIDKMPGNFLYVGLIHAALPHARFIHLRRDPLDTCLSIYCQYFRSGHAYANDLGDLAHHYAVYLRVMQHWRSELPPETMLEVSYEEMIEDLEGCSRRMLDFIGLPWDPACLEFHRSRRPVSTLSKWQARQQIYRGSVARWRNYAQFLGPLRGLPGTGRAVR